MLQKLILIQIFNGVVMFLRELSLLNFAAIFSFRSERLRLSYISIICC